MGSRVVRLLAACGLADAVGCGVILLGLVAGALALALALESTRAAGACAASGLLGIWLLVVPYLVGGPR